MASSDSKKILISESQHDEASNPGGRVVAAAGKVERLKRVAVVAEEGEGVRDERLKRRMKETERSVNWVPESWGKESFLNEWKDCTVIDQSLFPTGLAEAREALVKECRNRQQLSLVVSSHST